MSKEDPIQRRLDKTRNKRQRKIYNQVARATEHEIRSTEKPRKGIARFLFGK